MVDKADVDLEFDFGFSFTDETEDLKATIDTESEKAKEMERRLKALHAAILPFLNNLCKNPDKESIHWPNRVEKIAEYKKKLENIVKGKK